MYNKKSTNLFVPTMSEMVIHNMCTKAEKAITEYNVQLKLKIVNEDI
jgi:hypothetical protein